MLTDLIDNLLRDRDDLACDTLCDFLIDHPLTQSEAISLMHAAREIDPTESFHAAHIRDTLRDNFEFDLD